MCRIIYCVALLPYLTLPWAILSEPLVSISNRFYRYSYCFDPSLSHSGIPLTVCLVSQTFLRISLSFLAATSSNPGC